MVGMGWFPAKGKVRWVAGWVGALGVTLGGCTRASVRIAIEAERRADDVQQAVQQQQHEALCIRLYRDLIHRLQEAGAVLSPAQCAVVAEVWSDRDLLEFWALQAERARALRLVGVEAKLASDESIIDLLIKATEAPLDAIQQELGRRAGAEVVEGDS